MWMALGGQFAMGALGSLLGGNGAQRYIAKSQQYQQESQAYLQGAGQIKQLSKMLEAQGKSNEIVMRNDTYSFQNMLHQQGLAGLQNALSKRTATKNRALIHQGSVVQQAAQEAASASTGTIGAATDMMAQDIQRKRDRALTETEQQRELEFQQFHQDVLGLYKGYYQNQQQIDDTLPDVPDNPRVIQGYIPKSTGWGNHLLAGAMQAGGAYLNSYMNLQLGGK